MTDTNEPKDSFDEKYDSIMSPSAGGEQPEVSSPETEQQAETVDSTGEVQKTQGQPLPSESDKGFASHPAWQAREAKLKEAREALQAKEAEAQRYAKLLDELQKQRQTQPSSEVKQAQALSIAEQVCKLKNWDINRLNPEQRAIIEDQIELALGVFEIQSKQQQAELDKRLAPLEQARIKLEQEQVMAQAESRWESLSKEDGLDPKVVTEAINRYCLELDKTDPEKTLKLTDEDLYYRATRPLLREKEVSQARQEVRNTVKANARPLGKAPSTAVTGKAQSFKKDEDAYMEDLLSKHGVKN